MATEFYFTRETLKKFVDVLITGQYADNQLAKLLARNDPLLFLDLITDIEVETVPVINSKRKHLEIFDRIIDGNVIAAIKLTREMYKLGLKEAKEVIDCLREYMSDQGLCSSATCRISEPISLHSPYYSVFDNLRRDCIDQYALGRG
jgi:hypothetical protein